MTTPELVIIVITCTEDLKEPMVPVVPLTVAVEAEKLTVPKSASGRTPPLEDGASAIHSAEDRWARLTFEEVLKDAPVVVSVTFTVKDLPLKLASAEMWSPGVTVSPFIMNNGCGKNSNQA